MVGSNVCVYYCDTSSFLEKIIYVCMYVCIFPTVHLSLLSLSPSHHTTLFLCSTHAQQFSSPSVSLYLMGQNAFGVWRSFALRGRISSNLALKFPAQSSQSDIKKYQLSRVHSVSCFVTWRHSMIWTNN